MQLEVREMKRNLILSTLFVALLVVPAGASMVTSAIDSFNGTYVGGPIGPQPAGVAPATWTYFGYGPPAYSQQETGIVQPPYDGNNSSWRVNVPDTATNGTIILYTPKLYLNDYALPGQAIDWTQPVHLKVDVYAADYFYNTLFKTTLAISSYSSTPESLEWGNDGVPNAQWQTLTTVIDPGQAAVRGQIQIILDFDYTIGETLPGTVNAVIWDSLRLDYTAVPEPAGFLVMVVGGLLCVVRRPRS